MLGQQLGGHHPQALPGNQYGRATPALQRRCQHPVVARAGPTQEPTTKLRTEFPELPDGPDNIPERFFEDLYESDKVVPWDTGKEQPVVVKAFEQGLFTAPVLDVGCGYGTNTTFLGSKGLEVVGVDLSEAAIDEAERRLFTAGDPAMQNVTFKAGSVLDLANIFGDRKFASALDSALYHCLDDATNEKYLAALHKQLIPGSKLVLIAMTDRNPEEGWIGPRRISEATIRHSLREEAGWKLESLDMDAYYEVPTIMGNVAPMFSEGTGHALIAVATRI